MAATLLFCIGLILFPALVIWLCTQSALLRRIGPVLLCYLAGVIVGNTGILPDGFMEIQSVMQDISVALALPLLLFSLDVKRWLRISRSALYSMALAVVAVSVITVILQLALPPEGPQGWKIAGLAVGLYTGGTPNLASIKTALDVNNSTFIVYNTYDIVLSVIYLLFMVSIASVVFQKVFKLKAYRTSSTGSPSASADIGDESVMIYKKLFKPPIIKGLLLALCLSAALLGAAFVVGGFFPADISTAVTILLITSFGIAASFIRPVRAIRHTFHLGMYLIYVFCFTIATMTNFDVFAQLNGRLFIYIAITIFGSMALHALLCKPLKIDSDTMMVTSVSAVCSPPFVPLVASKLKNREVLISGLVTGIIGYAIGNYLGIGIAMLCRLL